MCANLCLPLHVFGQRGQNPAAETRISAGQEGRHGGALRRTGPATQSAGKRPAQGTKPELTHCNAADVASQSDSFSVPFFLICIAIKLFLPESVNSTCWHVQSLHVRVFVRFSIIERSLLLLHVPGDQGCLAVSGKALFDVNGPCRRWAHVSSRLFFFTEDQTQMRYLSHVPRFSLCFSQSHNPVITRPVLSELRNNTCSLLGGSGELLRGQVATLA